MAHYQVPGVSIAVIRNNSIEWAKGYGYRDVERKLPVDTHTMFEAGSISKPVAAMGALWLVEQGKLNLDENVNEKLKSWKVPVPTLPQVLDGIKAEKYGLGFQVEGAPVNSFSHGGVDEGFEAILICFPDTEQGVAIMTHAQGGMALANEIVHAMTDEYNWPHEPDH